MSTSRSTAPARTATFTVKAPDTARARRSMRSSPPALQWWPLRLARELDDAILMLRVNDLEVGTVDPEDRGRRRSGAGRGRRAAAPCEDTGSCAKRSASCAAPCARLDVSVAQPVRGHRPAARASPGSFSRVGARRRPHLHARRLREADRIRRSSRSARSNFGRCPWRTAARGSTRASRRRQRGLSGSRAASASRSVRQRRCELGLVTFAPDDIDWDDEVRLAIEERASLSPDALTGMEASLRFGGAGDDGDARSSAGSPPGRTGSSTAPTRSAKRARSRCSAAAARRNSTGKESEHVDARLQRTHPQQRRPRLPTARCSARSSTGSRNSSTGGRRWGRATSRPRTSICAPRPASTPRAGRTTARSRCPTIAGASSSPTGRRTARIGFGDSMGQPVWQQVPGEFRSTLRRLIVTQGDTEPASVEQQRLLGHTCPSLYDLRNLFQVNVEEGRHLWAMVYLLHAYFGRDGREEAEELLERHSGDARQAAHPRHVQRADHRLAVVLHVHLLHRPRRQVPAQERWPRAASIRSRAPAASC